MKKFFAVKTNIYITVAAVVVLAAGTAWWFIATSAAPTFGTYTVKAGNVVESVNETANVLAENNAPVSFQEGGAIAHVYVTEGEQVAAGAPLADLDAASLNAAVEQAQAGLATAQAGLAQLTAGTRPQQLTIDESAVASADQTLGIAVSNAYSASDDAVYNQLDNLFSGTQTSNPTYLVPNSNSQLINQITSERVAIAASLAQWYAALNATSTGSAASDPAALAGTAAANLQAINGYINQIALTVNEATPNGQLTAATLAAYKADVATARTEVQTSISAIAGDSAALTAAKNALVLAQAGATPQQIQTQEAVVAQAQAALATAQVAQGRATLTAPFAGTVTNLTAQVGQVVSPGVPIMSLVNNSGLKIEAYASEADVAKIKVGDSANVTLDAFGTGTVFPATVSTIAAAETQVNGAPAYVVTLHFTKPEPQIRDGMAGNANIVIGEHDNVPTVPSNLVINDGNEYYVIVERGGVQTKQQVQIGLKGDNGMTEIASGLTVGDTINTF